MALFGKKQKRDVISNAIGKLKESKKGPLIKFDNTVPATKYFNLLPKLLKSLKSIKK